MGTLVRVVFLLCSLQLAEFSDPSCTIELECEECVPDNMPLVSPQRADAARGVVSVAHGDEVTLACGAGRFQAYPLHGALAAECEAGRLRVRHDGRLRHLMELGCQENVFEDVLHQVEHCAAPLQGRSYQTLEAGSRATRHLAALCWEPDRALARFARASGAARNRLTLPAHADAGAPLSLLGNFNQMFDANTRRLAERLYSDDARLNRRLHELFKHDRISFADQTLTAAKLMAPHYFDDQNMRVTDFVSNKVAAWKSVVEGNLRHLHRDVAKLLRAARPAAALDVYTGTHGVFALRAGHDRKEVFLKPDRFPVPKYIWTVVHDTTNEKALAIVLLNDPFVAVSEIRESVFCESNCGSVSWLHELRRNRNYESPVYGLVFCCSVSNFTDIVTEMPKDIVKRVPSGNPGMILDLFPK